MTLAPEEFGLARVGLALAGSGPDENARILLRVLRARRERRAMSSC